MRRRVRVRYARPMQTRRRSLKVATEPPEVARRAVRLKRCHWSPARPHPTPGRQTPRPCRASRPGPAVKARRDKVRPLRDLHRRSQHGRPAHPASRESPRQGTLESSQGVFLRRGRAKAWVHTPGHPRGPEATAQKLPALNLYEEPPMIVLAAKCTGKPECRNDIFRVSSAALDLHFQTPHFQEFIKEFTRLLAAPPSIRVYEVTQVRNLEL